MSIDLPKNTAAEGVTARFSLYGTAAGLTMGIVLVVVLYLILHSPTHPAVGRGSAETNQTGDFLAEPTSAENPFGSGAAQTFALYKLSRVRLESGDIRGAIDVVSKIDATDRRDWALAQLAEKLPTDARFAMPDEVPKPDSAAWLERRKNALIALHDAESLIAQISEAGLRSRYRAALAKIRHDLAPVLREDDIPTFKSLSDEALADAMKAIDVRSADRKPWPFALLGWAIVTATTVGGFVSSNLLGSMLAEAGKSAAKWAFTNLPKSTGSLPTVSED